MTLGLSKNDNFRAVTANMQEYNSRKICTRCKKSKSSIGGMRLLRPGSFRRDFVCEACK